MVRTVKALVVTFSLITLDLFVAPLHPAWALDDKKPPIVTQQVEIDPQTKQRLERAQVAAKKLFENGDKEEALQRYTEIAETLLDAYGLHQQETVNAHLSQIAILQSLGRNDEVDILAKHWLNIASKMNPPLPKVLMQLRCARANVAYAKDDFWSAANHYQASYQIAEKAFGMESAPSRGYRLWMAHSHFQLGHYVCCEILVRPILQFQREQGAIGDELEQSLLLVGNSRYYRGDFESAADYLQELLEIRQREYGEVHPKTITTLGKYANCFDTLGKDFFGQSIHARWLRLSSEYRSKQGTEPTPTDMEEIGWHSLAAGDLEEAENWLTKCIESLKSEGETEDLATATRELAICLNRMEKPQQAEALARKYLENLADLAPSFRRTEVKIELASALLAQGKRDEAIRLRGELSQDPNIDPYFPVVFTVNGETLFRHSIPVLGTCTLLERNKSRYEALCEQIDGIKEVAAVPPTQPKKQTTDPYSGELDTESAYGYSSRRQTQGYRPILPQQQPR